MLIDRNGADRPPEPFVRPFLLVLDDVEPFFTRADDLVLAIGGILPKAVVRTRPRVTELTPLLTLWQNGNPGKPKAASWVARGILRQKTQGFSTVRSHREVGRH